MEATTTLHVTCPKCHRGYRVSPQFAGRKTRCKSCDTVIEVPNDGPAPAMATAVALHDSEHIPADKLPKLQGGRIRDRIAARREPANTAMVALVLGAAVLVAGVVYMLAGR